MTRHAAAFAGICDPVVIPDLPESTQFGVTSASAASCSNSAMGSPRLGSATCSTGTASPAPRRSGLTWGRFLRAHLAIGPQPHFHEVYAIARQRLRYQSGVHIAYKNLVNKQS